MAEQAALQASIRKWGRTFNKSTDDEMIALATAVHKTENKDFSAVKVEKGLKYGSDEKQRLNVYYPSNSTASSTLPMVLFFHGGSMVSGDTEISPLFYSNIGNFFATNSTICITATYRLLPSAKHPDGANDTVSAIKWALENSSSYGGDPARLTVIGHSAGGSIVGTALWGDYILNSNLLDKLSSSTFVFLSAGLWYDVLNPPTSINMPKYHHTDDLERIRREMPQSLFNGASKGAMAKWPKSKFFLAEYEFEEIVKGTTGLLDCWRENMDRELLVEVLEGENHVSYVYGIGLEGSKIGKRLLEIVRGE